MLISLILWITLILTIWFRTEAWIEYCRLLKINRISFYKDYEEKKKTDVSLTYLGYLRQYHNGFFTRLITCPVCLTIWLSMIGLIFTGNLITFPLICLGGLILFGIVDRLLG